jgi:hypothetical protein
MDRDDWQFVIGMALLAFIATFAVIFGVGLLVIS